jgi:hypothetical protein
VSAEYDVFVSYRRDSGSAEARLIRGALMAEHKRVFLDVTDLRSGLFDEALLGYIARAPNFVVILSPGAMDRCAQQDDWFRREIQQALDTDSNIVPVFMPGFTFPPKLPEELRSLPRHQGVEYSHLYFDAMIAKILTACDPASTQKRRVIEDLAETTAMREVPVTPPAPGLRAAPDPSMPAVPETPRLPPPVGSKRLWAPFLLWIKLGGVTMILPLLYFAYQYERGAMVASNPPVVDTTSHAGNGNGSSPIAVGEPPALPNEFKNLTPSVAGTSWEWTGTGAFFDFLPGGAFKDRDQGALFEGRWIQSGDRVFAVLNEDKYELTVSGDEMSGTYRPSPGHGYKSGPVKLRRLDRPAR